jgi:hypothetical protein
VLASVPELQIRVQEALQDDHRRERGDSRKESSRDRFFLL